MIRRLRMRDTIVRRFVLTILLAIAVTLLVYNVVSSFAGVLARPSIQESGLLQTATIMVRMLEAQPPETRAKMAAATETGPFRLEWYAKRPFDGPGDDDGDYQGARRTIRELLEDPGRAVLFFTSEDEWAQSPKLRYDRQKFPNAYFAAIELADRSWLVFTAAERSWGMAKKTHIAMKVLLVAVALGVFAMVTARTLARPIERLSDAVRRFGADPKAPPIEVSGPVELRTTIVAFNEMQAQISRFISDRTAMLAAISHDMRTPLTRIRLRAEFVEDPQQQKKLFRDVDEMQQMIDSALEFFRDDAAQEHSTAFDLPELLQSIADDYGDQGIEIGYRGPADAVHVGRPFALRRAFGNLIDNAVKYATPPEIALECLLDGMQVTIRDRGRGIPDEVMERVFAPFYRMEGSRNRGTGGVGLGLTSARSIIRAHGGEIVLRNHPAGGLEVLVHLPAAAT